MLYSTWRQSRDPAVAEEPPKASLPAQLLSKAVHGRPVHYWLSAKCGLGDWLGPTTDVVRPIARAAYHGSLTCAQGLGSEPLHRARKCHFVLILWKRAGTTKVWNRGRSGHACLMLRLLSLTQLRHGRLKSFAAQKHGSSFAKA
jgi:hypothetical protein